MSAIDRAMICDATLDFLICHFPAWVVAGGGFYEELCGFIVCQADRLLDRERDRCRESRRTQARAKN